MPIKTLPDHSFDQFLQQMGALAHCLAVAKSSVDLHRWRKGDLRYVVDQLELALGFLLGAKCVAIAQGTQAAQDVVSQLEVRVQL